MNTPVPYFVVSNPNETSLLHPLVSILAGEGRREHIVCNSCSPEDAKFIVTACNAHEDLLAALESIVDRGFDTGYYCYYCLEKTYGLGDKMTCDHKPDCYWAKARAAIAKARGQRKERIER